MKTLRRILILAVSVATIGVVLPAAPASAESEFICPNSPIPAGWIHTDSVYSPNVCGVGGTTPPWIITQWGITRINDRFKDDIVTMCIDPMVPIPTGWVEIAQAAVFWRCGLQIPQSGAPPNVRVIKCLSCPVRPPDPPAPTPTRGAIDNVLNTGVVLGWAQDPGRPGTSVRVDYYVDGPAGLGVPVGGALADVRRTDIAPGNHGMRFTLPAEYFDGRLHTLYAYGIDLTNDPPTQLLGSPKLFILPRRPIGFLENIDAAGNAVGWTLDPSLLGYGNTNSVDFLIDGFFVARVPANVPRPDVNTAYGYPGDHGFLWPIPNDFRDGLPHTLAVRATDLTGDEPKELPGSPKTFTLTRRPAAADFDGNGATDIAIWRPSDGNWWYGTSAVHFGQSGDVPVARDYDGDRRTDPAVFRNGSWYVLLPSGPIGYGFGSPGDKPVPGDYDGDGSVDAAVFRPSDNTWYIRRSDGSFYGVPYGAAGDKPVPGGYDGDGKTDIAVYRPLFGAWIVHQSSNGQDTFLQFGLSADRPVPADYDGDGRTDIAVFRPGNGTWHILQSIDGRYRSETYGLSGDQNAQGDYDGDGRTDIAVFRNGFWFIRPSRDGGERVTQFGMSGDLVVVGLPT